MKTCKAVKIEDGIKVSIPGMTGDWRRLIVPGDTDGKEAMGTGYLSQGDGRGWHTHPEGEEEVLYIIQGKALLEWKEEGIVKNMEASAGTALYTPGGIENNISNPYPEIMYCAFFIRLKV